ncbi:pectin acetylesterase [Aureococcus anophagefferens]|nr:pectin acetylesterase [Aureococcus anophagefferens]
MCGPPPAEAAPLLASTRPTASLRCAAVVSAALCLLAYAARGPAGALAPAALAVEADGPATDGPPGGWARVLDRHLLDGDPRAVCNDGTPALYYYAPASRGGAAWVVHLQGGGACVSADECAANEAAYAAKGQTWHFSSKASKEHLGAAPGTILSDGESALLGDAHAVYVWYCSSDAWVGDRGASDATGGRHFRGSRILTPSSTTSSGTAGLGAGAETLVVFSGSSAGGRGVVQHADRLAKRALDDAFLLHRVSDINPDAMAADDAAAFAAWRGSEASARPSSAAAAAPLLGNYRNLETVGGESFAAYVDRFAAAALAGGAPPAPVVDACAGFACGAGCFATARGEVADVADPFAYAAATFDAPPAP